MFPAEKNLFNLVISNLYSAGRLFLNAQASSGIRVCDL